MLRQFVLHMDSKVCLDPHFPAHTKSGSRWITDIHVKEKPSNSQWKTQGDIPVTLAVAKILEAEQKGPKQIEERKMHLKN